MEKHNYSGKTKEEAIQQAKEELQETEENLLHYVLFCTFTKEEYCDIINLLT